MAHFPIRSRQRAFQCSNDWWRDGYRGSFGGSCHGGRRRPAAMAAGGGGSKGSRLPFEAWDGSIPPVSPCRLWIQPWNLNPRPEGQEPARSARGSWFSGRPSLLPILRSSVLRFSDRFGDESTILASWISEIPLFDDVEEQSVISGEDEKKATTQMVAVATMIG